MAVESCGDIHALPENCIANVLSLTSPKDAGRLALVASNFSSASHSDSVWERFLPADYSDVIACAVGGSDSVLGKIRSKKDLYFYLCDNPILIDGGRKSFSLEKCSGKKRYMLAARDLSIIWSDTPEYWRWISLPESRFSEVAELLDVCWLEIRGKINASMLSPGTNYAAYLVFSCHSRTYGFGYCPAEASVALIGHETRKRSVCLEPRDAGQARHQIVPMNTILRRWIPSIIRANQEPDPNIECPKRRDDGWFEVELGELFIEAGEDVDLEMSLMETKGGRWKSGIIIEGIEIRPKDCK